MRRLVGRLVWHGVERLGRRTHIFDLRVSWEVELRRREERGGVLVCFFAAR
jgi:hypothetical protein